MRPKKVSGKDGRGSTNERSNRMSDLVHMYDRSTSTKFHFFLLLLMWKHDSSSVLKRIILVSRGSTVLLFSDVHFSIFSGAKKIFKTHKKRSYCTNAYITKCTPPSEVRPGHQLIHWCSILLQGCCLRETRDVLTQPVSECSKWEGCSAEHEKGSRRIQAAGGGGGGGGGSRRGMEMYHLSAGQ